MAQLGDYKTALGILPEFKGKIFRRELFYEEGLWILYGVYSILADENSRYSIDEKIFKKILKDAGGFYGKGAGPLKEYIKIREKPYFAYGEALKFFFDSKYNESLAILYDIVDDKKSRKNEYLALDSSRTTIKLAHLLIAKALEKTGEADEADINVHYESSDYYNLTSEINFKSIELKSDEIKINIASLMPTITGEVKLKKGNIPRPNPKN